MSLLDSGKTGQCIDRVYSKSQRFKLIKLTQPFLVYNVDRSPNEAGSIKEVVILVLCYKNHLEQTTFCITGLGKQKLILGHSWLYKYNLKINWETGEVKMSRCPPCCCRDELHQERIARKTETRRINICSIRPAPEINHDSNLDSEFDTVDPEDEPISVEEGNWILATGLLPSCQGTSLAVCTPLYTLFTIHSLPSFHFAHICLLLFGYHLTLCVSQ